MQMTHKMLSQLFKLTHRQARNNNKQVIIRERYQSDPGRGLRTLDEVLRGRPHRCVNMVRMTASCFNALCDELGPHIRSSEKFPVREKVALFLQFAGQALSERKLEEDFQRPRSKINETKECISNAIIQYLYPTYVDNMRLAATVQAVNEKFKPNEHAFSWPLRQAAIAFDGTFFHQKVAKEQQNAYRDRHHHTSLNTLLCCTYNQFVTFCYAGSEGSNCDSGVLETVRDDFFNSLSTVIEVHGERVATLFLGDAIYGLSERIMTPFRGIRYHLKEWEGKRPENAHEMYNLQHAKLRNVIERTIGLLKRRWKILREQSECYIEHHVKHIYALVALHNFIKVHRGDIEDEYLEDPAYDNDDDGLDLEDVQDQINMRAAGVSTAALYQAAVSKRESLAQEIWNIYRQLRAAQGDPLPP